MESAVQAEPQISVIQEQETHQCGPECDHKFQKLALGSEKSENKTQIITADGQHLCYIEQDPHKVIAERIIETFNAPADVVVAGIVTLVRNMQRDWEKHETDNFGKKYKNYRRALDLFLTQLGVQPTYGQITNR